MSPADPFEAFERCLRAQDRAEKTVGDYEEFLCCL
jgi:hypothetical protein